MESAYSADANISCLQLCFRCTRRLLIGLHELRRGSTVDEDGLPNGRTLEFGGLSINALTCVGQE